MKRFTLAFALLLLVGLAAAQPDDTIDFGYVEWPGVTVKSQVAAVLLEDLGYETELQALSVPIVLRGLAENDLDVFLAVWRPSMNQMLAPYLDEGEGDGSIALLATNLEPTIYRPAVPTYVAEEGIESLADVGANAETFDGRFYGIEPGNDGNEIVRGMIADDVYGFSSMELVESSTQGMLSAVEDAIEDEEPIVFLGWSPHWMNAEYDMTYLDDPQNVWGGDGLVATATNAEWAAANENVATFLRQFVVTPEIQNAWIADYSLEGNDPRAVAEAWIDENLDLVTEWLEGVETIDGGDAVEAVRAAHGG